MKITNFGKIVNVFSYTGSVLNPENDVEKNLIAAEANKDYFSTEVGDRDGNLLFIKNGLVLEYKSTGAKVATFIEANKIIGQVTVLTSLKNHITKPTKPNLSWLTNSMFNTLVDKFMAWTGYKEEELVVRTKKRWEATEKLPNQVHLLDDQKVISVLNLDGQPLEEGVGYVKYDNAIFIKDGIVVCYDSNTKNKFGVLATPTKGIQFGIMGSFESTVERPKHPGIGAITNKAWDAIVTAVTTWPGADKKLVKKMLANWELTEKLA